MSLTKKEASFDSWNAIHESMSKANQAKYFNKFKNRLLLPENTVAEIYRNDGIGKKVVDLPVFYMLKEGFEVPNDKEKELNKVFMNSGVLNSIEEHLTWNKVYGGSLFIAGINDGQDWDMPVNFDNIQEVEFFQVWERHRIQIKEEDLQKDPKQKRYNLPEFYTIRPQNGAEFKVHYTRTHALTGVLTPSRVKRNYNDYWGDSVYQATLDSLGRMNSAYKSIDSILDSFIQIIMSIENLQGMIAAGQKEQVLERLAIIQAGLDINNIIMMDGREKFEKSSSTVTGLPDVLQEFYIHVAAVFKIPVTLLMGRSPAGENATGQHDLDNWYDLIRYEQNQEMRPLILWLCKLFKADKSLGMTFQDEPMIQFNPLAKLTRKEKSEIFKNYAEGDTKYELMNAIHNDEARTRFTDDGFKDELVLDKQFDNPEDRELIDEEGNEVD